MWANEIYAEAYCNLLGDGVFERFTAIGGEIVSELSSHATEVVDGPRNHSTDRHVPYFAVKNGKVTKEGEFIETIRDAFEYNLTELGEIDGRVLSSIELLKADCIKAALDQKQPEDTRLSWRRYPELRVERIGLNIEPYFSFRMAWD